MNVLFAVSECVPFIKTGGLADVAGALPKELKQLGTNVSVIMPKYSLISEKYSEQMTLEKVIYVQVGWRRQYCGIYTLEMNGTQYIFIDNEYYFKRDSLYGHYDDAERFAFFSKAVLEAIPTLVNEPDIIHCHDWHTAMIPFLLRAQYSMYDHIETVFTIHNLQFQGIFPKQNLYELLNLNEYHFTSNQLEFYGNLNFMKGGIVSADKITTVSPTYRNEIQMPYYGEKLDGLLRQRDQDLIGIVNGIDDQAYNPENDELIAFNYSAQDLAGKYKNKEDLQAYLGLDVRNDVPLVSMVTRLTKQKGLDLVKHVFHEIIRLDAQVVILGTGEAEFESFFKEMESHYPNQVKAIIGFNEALAHKVYAGSDLFLMPSKFEPCGLGQLIALRYGAIPIVRETGGLNDTVLSYNEYTYEGNGFTFANYNAHDMLYTIERAISFYNDKDVWEKLMRDAMSQDYSWAQSAFKYNQLYANLTSISS
ncbi:glycogen synthase GlgA [Priestia flexa]|uniref:Glycogen synthase n=1 Tax=Priestia flexa TaxID=86664 RepID=A0A8I1MK55_9BACI|nr:glycogen synthase GlgA [Priestia flexa]MBN8254008.1 glycogen synthase GlgA [Priestia flexa]MBN8436411.1 glycogen synthase GlgA [Priestia flexa]MCA0968958.1 glycogen synthase GlgA [Priestia flexa]RIV09694.1 glycogen synthase GlgA [Priestia flexa]UIR29676.1 glycogen synthase GlgA [Priestia flexa]